MSLVAIFAACSILTPRASSDAFSLQDQGSPASTMNDEITFPLILADASDEEFEAIDEGEDDVEVDSMKDNKKKSERNSDNKKGKAIMLGIFDLFKKMLEDE